MPTRSLPDNYHYETRFSSDPLFAVCPQIPAYIIADATAHAMSAAQPEINFEQHRDTVLNQQHGNIDNYLADYKPVITEKFTILTAQSNWHPDYGDIVNLIGEAYPFDPATGKKLYTVTAPHEFEISIAAKLLHTETALLCGFSEKLHPAQSIGPKILIHAINTLAANKAVHGIMTYSPHHVI